MNLLLVEPEELGGDGTCVVRDHRALHLRSVIGVRAGWHVRAGVVGGGIGSAEVKADDGVAITLRLKLTEPAPLPLPIELVLAVPRPKVLSRTVEIAAAFGVARIDLTNAWRVDKGYLTSAFSDSTPERGGRSKRYFKVKPLGLRTLRASHDALSAMWDGLEPLVRRAT